MPERSEGLTSLARQSSSPGVLTSLRGSYKTQVATPARAKRGLIELSSIKVATGELQTLSLRRSGAQTPVPSPLSGPKGPKNDPKLGPLGPNPAKAESLGRYRLRETHMLHPVQLKDPSPFATFGPERAQKGPPPDPKT